jgi:MerR family transcriptional regulator, thiopeptide resistance regulator
MSLLLKIGELARRTGLTVRALHHYDAIGLLVPSARSDAGYRLYDRADIARLHRIQVLRKFGLSLADIGAGLDKPELPLAELVAQQIEMLSGQIEQAAALRARLQELAGELALGREPDLSAWLTTLEHMAMYDKYFSRDELQKLPIYKAAPTVRQQWKSLVEAVRAMIEAGAAPASAPAQDLGEQWMAMIKRDTGANALLMAKLSRMHAQETLVQERTGITPAVLEFILAARRARALAIYRRYLTDEEFAYLEENYGKRAAEWMPLLGRLRGAMDEGLAPDDAAVQAMARHWHDLFRSYAGDDPQTQAKFRKAHECEPGLTSPWIDAALLAFIRAAIAALAARQTGIDQRAPAAPGTPARVNC